MARTTDELIASIKCWGQPNLSHIVLAARIVEENTGSSGNIIISAVKRHFPSCRDRRLDWETREGGRRIVGGVRDVTRSINVGHGHKKKKKKRAKLASG